MTRPDPFALVFAPLEEDLAAIRGDAERVGRDPRDRAGFAHVPAVQRLLGQLTGGGGDPAATAEYLALLHVAFRFWDAGQPVLEAGRDALTRAFDRTDVPVPVPPRGACYVRLPHGWIWSRVGDDAPHEPMDGCFLAAAPRGDEVTVLAVLGLRPERGGFSQVSVSAHPDDVRATPALARPDRFAPVMDGGAAADFRSVVSAAELLLLGALAYDCARG